MGCNIIYEASLKAQNLIIRNAMHRKYGKYKLMTTSNEASSSSNQRKPVFFFHLYPEY